MKSRIACTAIVIASLILLISACKPTVDSSPGHACFTLYSIGEDGTKVENVTTVKVGQEIGADITCAGKCKNNYNMAWGDGDYGEYLTHKYNTPGTYTLKYECSDRTIREQKRDKKRKRYFRGGRYESTKVISVIP